MGQSAGPLSEVKREEVDMSYARYGLIAILLSIFFLPLNASAVHLDELINLGESITVGDKLFTNFSGSLFSGGANPFAIDQIEVAGFSAGDRHGLSFFVPFDPAQPPPSGFSGGPSSSVDLRVGFDVTVTGGHNAITGIAVGMGVFLMDASIFLTAGGASAAAFGDFFGPLSSDVFTFSTPTTFDHVDAGLFLMAQPGIDSLFQAFDYNVSIVQSASVPESSTALLLVFGGVVIAATAHKVRRA
jgi:hypothetical protein